MRRAHQREELPVLGGRPPRSSQEREHRDDPRQGEQSGRERHDKERAEPTSHHEEREGDRECAPQADWGWKLNADPRRAEARIHRSERNDVQREEHEDVRHGLRLEPP